jgi:hypothetical protein
MPVASIRLNRVEVLVAEAMVKLIAGEPVDVASIKRSRAFASLVSKVAKAKERTKPAL